MGTIGAVGVGTPEEFRAVHVGFDAYPSGLGRDAFLRAKKMMVEGDLDQWGQKIVDDHPSGWRGINVAFPLDCYCHGDNADPADHIHTQDDVDKFWGGIALINPETRMFYWVHVEYPSIALNTILEISLESPEPDWKRTDAMREEKD